MPGASHSPNPGDSRTSRVQSWTAGDAGTGQRRQSSCIFRDSGWTWGPSTWAISAADQINSHHSTSPGRLKSGLYACAGIPSEPRRHDCRPRMSWKMGGAKGKGCCAGERNPTEAEGSRAENFAPFSRLSEPILRHWASGKAPSLLPPHSHRRTHVQIREIALSIPHRWGLRFGKEFHGPAIYPSSAVNTCNTPLNNIQMGCLPTAGQLRACPWPREKLS